MTAADGLPEDCGTASDYERHVIESYVEELEHRIEVLEAEVGVAYEDGYREGYDQAEVDRDDRFDRDVAQFIRDGGWLT